jgi:hypothetical protein
MNPMKRRAAERARKLVTAKLQMTGFVRGKTSFWVRPQASVIEFLHLHLFTFAHEFRAHAGIRVLNDAFEARALNGPSSGDYWLNGRKAYCLEFRESDASIEACAVEVARFCADIAEPWFNRLRELNVLLATDSPLTDDARSGLHRWLRGSPDPEAVKLSKDLFGVV